MKSLKTALMMAAIASVPSAMDVRAIGGSTALAPAAQARVAPTRSDRDRFVGTYSLVTTEVKDASGKWSPTPNFNSNGYITYSEDGYMGVHIMPKVRARFAAAQPTPEEALQALRGYTAYFGSFGVNENEKSVVHHRFGQIAPGGPPDADRFYDFVIDR